MPHGAVPFPFGDCRICGDQATGVHYGVVTCEGCKGFFKRSLPKGDKYRCFFGGQCALNPQNRNRCKACRFARCLAVGMSVEAVKMGRIPKVDKERALDRVRMQNPGAIPGSTLTTAQHSHVLRQNEVPAAAPNGTISDVWIRGYMSPNGRYPGLVAAPAMATMFAPAMAAMSKALQGGMPSLGMSDPTANIKGVTGMDKMAECSALRSGAPPQQHTIRVTQNCLPNTPGVHSQSTVHGKVGIHRSSTQPYQISSESTRSTCLTPFTHMERDIMDFSKTETQPNETLGGFPKYHQPVLSTVSLEGGNMTGNTHVSSFPAGPSDSAGSSGIFVASSWSEEQVHVTKSLSESGRSSGISLDSSPFRTGGRNEEEAAFSRTCYTPLSTAAVERSTTSRLSECSSPKSSYTSGIMKELIVQVVDNYGMDGLQNILSAALQRKNVSIEDESQHAAVPSECVDIQELVKYVSRRKKQRCETGQLNGAEGESGEGSVLPQGPEGGLQQAKAEVMERFLCDMIKQHQVGVEIQIKKEVTDNDFDMSGNDAKHVVTRKNAAFNRAPPSAILGLASVMDSGPDENLAQACLDISLEDESMDHSKKRATSMSVKDLNEIDNGTALTTQHTLSIQVLNSLVSMTYAGKQLDEGSVILVQNTLQRLEVACAKFGKTLQKYILMMDDEVSGKVMAHPLNRVKQVTTLQQHYFWRQLFSAIPESNENVLGFCREVPGFTTLSEDDQKTVMGEAYFDLWVLQNNPLFRDGDSYLYMPHGMRYSYWWMCIFLSPRVTQRLHDFQRRLQAWNPSHLELAILCAIRLFRIGPIAVDEMKQQLSLLADHYLDVLAYSVHKNHQSNSTHLVGLIELLNDLPVEVQELKEKVGKFIPTDPPNCVGEEVICATPLPVTAGDENPWNQPLDS